MTFLGLAVGVLKKQSSPMPSTAIWERFKELNLIKDLNIKNRTVAYNHSPVFYIQATTLLYSFAYLYFAILFFDYK